MAEPQKLLIIGYGNMSGAMLAGWLRAGVDPSTFAILNRSSKSAPEGVELFTDVAKAQAFGPFDAVMLGFKPHQLTDLATGFQDLVQGRAVHSLLAGITLAQLQNAFPDAEAHIRVMPNLASRINKSPIILAASNVDEAERSALSSYYDKLGNAVWLEDESQYDLATALAGSGPGFVYRFIDALSVAGAELGLDAPQARALALSMVEGAAGLAASSEFSPAELADKVASPGGMTRQGLNVLDSDDALVSLLTDTLRATRDRGAELSKGSN